MIWLRNSNAKNVFPIPIVSVMIPPWVASPFSDLAAFSAAGSVSSFASGIYPRVFCSINTAPVVCVSRNSVLHRGRHFDRNFGRSFFAS